MMKYPDLYRTAFDYPAIDNHAHQLIKAENRDDLPFEGIISEATGDGLLKDAVETLACYRATKQLAELFGLPSNASWEEVKAKRAQVGYEELCKLCFRSTRIQTILVDDGLNYQPILHDISWHDRLIIANNACKRIVRIETVAEEFLEEVVRTHADRMGPFWNLTNEFWDRLHLKFIDLASQADVAGFKSVICYRTGLAVSSTGGKMVEINRETYGKLKQESGRVRFNIKEYNDCLVHLVLGIVSGTGKPVQFHTGLGDGDLTLTLASPSHLQPTIKMYPDVTFVLLHSSYPYTRDAGYLASIHQNVYVDFGEVFPIVAAHGQRSIIRQLLEITPTNKLMWSTDAHFWPETYYLGTRQSREALYTVLSQLVDADELTEQQAVKVLQNMFFHTANRVYKLNLEPVWK